MSDKRDHDDHATHGATTIRASKGGGGGKWLLGAVAAAILVGGGYYAWSNYGQNQNTQSALTDTYADETYGDDPLRASTLPDEQEPLAESASIDDRAAAPASTPARRSTPARTEPVPEETIGITPINATTYAQEGDDIIVPATPRPIWVGTPSQRRLSALYPSRALDRGREGEARLACIVQARGMLDCERVSETPGGFGAAAVRVANTFRHAPTLADGSDATGSPVNLRVVFRIDDNTRRG